MKINFVVFSTKLTGGTRFILEIMNGLAERGHELNLVTLGKPEDHSWIDLKAKVTFVNRTFVQKVFGYLYRMAFGFQPWPEEETRRMMKATPECDINVATISYSGYAVSRSKRGIPFHFYMHYEPFVREEGYKRRIIEESYCLPTRKIVNSSWLEQTIKKETNQSVEGLVFPAIDHSIFKAVGEKQPVDKSKPITIVGLAKYKRWKGIPEALKAIQIVRDRGYAVDFQMFGGAFDPATLPDDVKHVAFTFVGKKVNEELARFYSSADILISASFFESFPLPQLEAMACGTPVVTTRFGTEDYAVHGKNALVVPPKEPRKMAEAIIDLIEKPELYIQLSRAGVETAKKFTWDAATDQIEGIFKRALSEHKE